MAAHSAHDCQLTVHKDSMKTACWAEFMVQMPALSTASMHGITGLLIGRGFHA